VFFTPIVATILGLVFLDESVSITAVIGMCVVICGAYLTSRPDKVAA
jgi:drug/metabolite transporter (DMT)-like permease